MALASMARAMMSAAAGTMVAMLCSVLARPLRGTMTRARGMSRIRGTTRVMAAMESTRASRRLRATLARRDRRGLAWPICRATRQARTAMRRIMVFSDQNACVTKVARR